MRGNANGPPKRAVRVTALALVASLDGFDRQQSLLVVRLAAVAIGEWAEEDVLPGLLQIELGGLREASIEDSRGDDVLDVEVRRRRAVLRDVALDLAERRRGALDRDGDEQVERILPLRLERDVVLAGL